MAGRRTISILVAAVAACALSGCGSKPVVGVILPVTGSASGYGESIESGMRLAIADARTKGELPADFEVVWADSESDPAKAMTEYRRLVDERGAKIILGAATSTEARALIPVIDDTDVICLSPSASAPDLSKLSKRFFRIYPSDELEGHTAGKFMVDRLGASKVILLRGDSDYVRGIEPEFRRQFAENLGGEVAATVELTGDAWRDELDDALAAHEFQAAYIIAYSDQIVEAIQRLRAVNYRGRILTTSAFFTSKAIQSAGEDAEGVLFPLPPFDRTSDKEPVVSFVNRYMDTYERAPDVFAAHGYDAMRVAILVFEIADPPETMEINKALHFGVTDFMGVTGPILFDDFGDVKHYPKMFIFKDGQVQSYRRYLETERKRILRQVQSLLISEG